MPRTPQKIPPVLSAILIFQIRAGQLCLIYCHWGSMENQVRDQNNRRCFWEHFVNSSAPCTPHSYHDAPSLLSQRAMLIPTREQTQLKSLAAFPIKTNCQLLANKLLNSTPCIYFTASSSPAPGLDYFSLQSSLFPPGPPSIITSYPAFPTGTESLPQPPLRCY